MTTVGRLIDDISFRMHSYTGTREKVTYLTGGIDSDDVVMAVADASAVDRGLIEIDDELIRVSNVEDDGTVAIFPFGRGEAGTTATSHAMSVKVTNDPILSSKAVLDAVIETVEEISPELFQVKTTEFAYDATSIAFSLPADVDRILQVTADMPGVTRMWPEVCRWRFERSASAGEFATGKSLEIYEGLSPGYSVRVTYAAAYEIPATRADDLADLGIQDSVKEVIFLGACWRLTQYLEVQRLQLQTVEQMARQAAVPAGATVNLAKYFLSAYQLRREQERKKLLTLNPAQIHRTA